MTQQIHQLSGHHIWQSHKSLASYLYTLWCLCKDLTACAAESFSPLKSRRKLSLRVGFLAGGPVERRCGEEEAGGAPGEHDKPRKLLQQNMDSKFACTTNCSTVMLSKCQKCISHFIRSGLLFFVLWHPCDIMQSGSASLGVWLCQEGLCSLWFGASCFRSSRYCIGRVQAADLVQEGCATQ